MLKQATAALTKGAIPIRWIYAAAAVLLVGYSVLTLFARTGIFSDSGWGFMAWSSLLRGAPFNYVIAPDPADLNRDITGFMTVWSPGQWVVPGMFSLLFGNIGLGIVVAVAVCSAMGLFGLYRLFRALGLEARVTAFACLIVACGRYFILPFGEYNGGDTVLFAVAPWIAYLLYITRAKLWMFCACLALALVVATFAKLSGLILALAILGGVTAVCFFEESRTRFAVRVAAAGAVCLVFAVCFKLFWLNLGWTAADVSPGGPQIGRFFSEALPTLSAVVFASVSLGDLLKRLLMFPGSSLIGSLGPVYLLFVPLAAFLLWRFVRRMWPQNRNYALFAGITALGFFSIMAILYVRSANLEVDDRHFRLVSILILPGLLIEIAAWRGRIARTAALGVLVVLVGYGLLSAVPRFRSNFGFPIGVAGFREQLLDRPAMAYLRGRLAETLPPSRAITLVPSPEMALELPGRRVIGTQVDFEPESVLKARVYHGRPSNLDVLIQQRLLDSGKAALVLRAFVDIKPQEWASTPVGSFVVFRFRG